MDAKEMCRSCNMAFGSPRAYKAHVKHHETLEREAQREAECFMKKKEIEALRESESKKPGVKLRAGARKSSTPLRKGAKKTGGRNSTTKKKRNVSGVKEEASSSEDADDDSDLDQDGSGSDDDDNSPNTDEDEDFDDRRLRVKKRGRGRPRLYPLRTPDRKDYRDSPAPKRSRGRPKLKKEEDSDEDDEPETVSDIEEADKKDRKDSTTPKRSRGRPKLKKEEDTDDDDEQETVSDVEEAPTPKRGRGRPKKKLPGKGTKEISRSLSLRGSRGRGKINNSRSFAVGRSSLKRLRERTKSSSKCDADDNEMDDDSPPPKRSRGRPPKSAGLGSKTKKGKKPRGRPKLKPSPAKNVDAFDSEDDDDDDDDVDRLVVEETQSDKVEVSGDEPDDGKEDADGAENQSSPSSSMGVGKRQVRKPKKYIKEEGEDNDGPHETFFISPDDDSMPGVNKIVVQKPGKPMCVVLKVRRPVGRPRLRPPDVICEKTGRTLVVPNSTAVQNIMGSLPSRGRPTYRVRKLLGDDSFSDELLSQSDSKSQVRCDKEASIHQEDDHSYPRRSLENEIEKQIEKQVPEEATPKKQIIHIEPIEDEGGDGGSDAVGRTTDGQKVITGQIDKGDAKKLVSTKKEAEEDGQDLKCPSCGKECSNLCGLKSHKRSHNMLGRKQHTCHICGRQFSQLGTLRVHIRMHTGEKPFACAVCMKGFATLSSCKIHMRTHTGERPFQCDVCSLMFKQAGHLRDHARRHHDEPGRSLCMRCPICDKVLSCKSALKTHMRIHEDIRPFQCELCGRAFRQRGHLKDHIETHNTDRKKPFICDICGNAFVNANVLHNHHLTHTGEKPYECTVCSRRFRQRGHLKDHMLTHENGNKSITFKKINSRPTGTVIEVGSVNGQNNEVTPKKQQQSLLTPQPSVKSNNSSLTTVDVMTMKEGWQVATIKSEPTNDPQLEEAIVQAPKAVGYRSILQATSNKPAPAVENGISCLCCSQRFLNVEQLTQHVDQAHMPSVARQRYKCSYCGTQMTSIEQVNQHLLQFHQVKATNLLANALKRSEKVSHSCVGCDQLFSDVKLLKQHFMLQHTQNLSPPEPAPQIVYTTAPVAPARAPSPPLAYQCPICSELSTTWEALGKHVQKHGMQIIATGAETGALLDTSAELSTAGNAEHVATVLEQPGLGDAMSELPVVIQDDVDYAYVEYVDSFAGGDGQVEVTHHQVQNQQIISAMSEQAMESAAGEPLKVEHTVETSTEIEIQLSEPSAAVLKTEETQDNSPDAKNQINDPNTVVQEAVESQENLPDVGNQAIDLDVVVQETIGSEGNLPDVGNQAIDLDVVVQETIGSGENLPDVGNQATDLDVVVQETTGSRENLPDVGNQAIDLDVVVQETIGSDGNVSDVGNQATDPAGVVQLEVERHENSPDIENQISDSQIVFQEVESQENLSDVENQTRDPGVVESGENLADLWNQTSDIVMHEEVECQESLPDAGNETTDPGVLMPQKNENLENAPDVEETQTTGPDIVMQEEVESQENLPDVGNQCSYPVVMLAATEESPEIATHVEMSTSDPAANETISTVWKHTGESVVMEQEKMDIQENM